MIGDVLTSSILFEAIKQKFSEAQLHYLINQNTSAVVEHNPFIDKLKIITPEIESNKRNFYSFLKQIKAEKYDAVIDVYSKTSSNLITKSSDAKIRISKYKWYTSFLYSHTVKEEKTPKSNAGLAIENRLKLLEPLGIYPEIIKPKIYLTEQEIVASKKLLEDSNIDLKKPLFMISVLGSDDSKTYPLAYMAKIIDNIVKETKGQILFNYIPNQINEAKTVFNLCKKESKKHIHFNVFGKSLREFLAITKHCDALIGNEGGAVNMAKALGISTFTIFSPWILKEAWNMFEDGKTHVSVHLKDEKIELFDGKSSKIIKSNTFKLYNNFFPGLITPKLNAFLQQFKL